MDEKTRLAGTAFDEYSSNNSNVSHAANKELEVVDNMLNEASTFNCHQIQAANFDSNVSLPGGGAFTGVENRLEESSLIYKPIDYDDKK